MSNSTTVKKILEVDDKFSRPLTKFKKGMGDVATASDKADKEVGEFNVTTAKGGKVSDKTAQSLTALKGGAVAVGVAIAGASVALAKHSHQMAEMADEIGKASQRMNVSIEFYQRMTSASGHAGTSITTIETAMRTMLRTMEQVNDGSSRMVDTYNSLGIQIHDTNGEMRNQEQLFRETLIALSEMENKTERNATAQKLLGRSASQLAPLFNEGADAVRNYMNANDSAVVVSQRMADTSARYNDNMLTIQETLQQTKTQAFEPLIQSMSDLTTWFLDSGAIDSFTDYLEDVGTVASWVIEKFNDMMGVKTLPHGVEALREELDFTNDGIITLTKNIEELESIPNISFGLAESLVEQREKLEEYESWVGRVESALSVAERKAKDLDSLGGGSGGSPAEPQENTYDAWASDVERSAVAHYVRMLEYDKKFQQDLQDADSEQLEYDKEQAELSTERRLLAKEQELADLVEMTEARREMVAQAIMSAGDIASAFASVSASKYNQIKKEYDYEEKRIKNSTMSETKKAKALEALAKKRKEAEIEQAKRQVAFAVMTGATNTALAIQNGILAITGVGANQPGGFAIKAGAMLAMAGVVATQIAQVKSAQAQIPQREHGGVMRKDELYEVAERNKDEVFQRGGKNYMMPSSGGRAIPNAGGGSTNITMNVSFGAGTNADDVLEVLPEAVASALEKADKQGIVQYSRMSNFQREIGN